MKQQIFRWMVSLVAATSLLTACSEDPEPVVPRFPEVVEATLSAGESYTLHIEPNTAWRVAISSDAATYFYLLDEGSKVYTMRGAAGSYDLQIGVSSIEEFDTERSCEVLLTMGEGAAEETRTIARLKRGKISRDLQIFAARAFDEETSDFVQDEAGNYLYGESPIASLELVKNLNDLYLHRIAIESNHAWAFAGELPAWFVPSLSSGAEGRTELQLRTNMNRYPFEASVAKIGFNDMTVQHAPTLTEATLSISIPGCADYVNLQLGSVLNFNVEGLYNNEGSYVDSGAIGWLTAPMGAVVYKAVKENGYYYTAPERTFWFTVDEEFEADASMSEGVWSRKLVVKSTANEGAAREGLLVVVPQSKAGSITDPDMDLFNAEGTALKEEFAAYASTIEQDAYVSPEEIAPIEIADLEALQAYGGDFAALEADSWVWNTFDVKHAYKMTYSSNDTSNGGDLTINLPYDQVRIIGFDASTVLQTNGYDGSTLDGADRSWVTVEMNPYGIENRRRVTCRLGDEFPNTCPGDMGENEAFLLFKGADGENLALIYFVLDPSFKPGTEVGGATVSFVNPVLAAEHGASLAEIVAGDEDFSKEDEAMGIKQYRLTYSNRSANEAVLLNVPDYHLLISQNEWLSAVENGDGTIRVVMESEKGVGIINLYDASWQVIVKIICVMDPEADVADPYDPNGPVTFLDRAAAEAMGATLYVIGEEDDSYDKDMGYKGVPQYRLTMKQAGTITLKVPTYYIAWSYQSWLTCTPDWPENGATEATLTMSSNGAGRQKSNLTFYVDMSEGTIAAQIECILLNE